MSSITLLRASPISCRLLAASINVARPLCTGPRRRECNSVGSTSKNLAGPPTRFALRAGISNRSYSSSSSSMAGPATATVKSLDHIVLTVRDIEATVAFYTAHLGMAHESFSSPSEPGVERHALRFGAQKINLHRSGAEFEPKAARVQPGSGDLCFLTDEPVDGVLDRFKAAGIDILEGGKVVDRTGAVGKLRSLYVRDPDGNLVEISNYQ